MNQNHAEDVAAASAALLWNILPDIVKLPACEGYARLQEHLEACIFAYRESLSGFGLPPEPSDN